MIHLLFVIPHFFKPIDAGAPNRSGQPAARINRIRSLLATVTALTSTFGNRIYGLDHGERILWQARPRYEVDIVVCTAGDDHLLDEIPALRGPIRHHETAAAPRYLGFECHRVLAEGRGRYDYYGYIEDDIVLSDPLFFNKRALFDDLFGPEALLQPNRWEGKSEGHVQKLYVDYRIRSSLTAPYQRIDDRTHLEMRFLGEPVRFERTSYPSAGCFFLSREQLAIWADSAAFGDRDVSYMSPLDSAATLSIMKVFRIYKPVLDQAWFLEVQHASPRWVSWTSAETRLVPHKGA